MKKEYVMESDSSSDKKQSKCSVMKAKQVDLAKYLGVSKSAVSQYDKKKLELMLLGLAVKKEHE